MYYFAKMIQKGPDPNCTIFKKKTAKCLEVITKCSLFAAEISLKLDKTSYMKKLTDKEIAIMNVLWDGEPMSMRDIL